MMTRNDGRRVRFAFEIDRGEFGEEGEEEGGIWGLGRRANARVIVAWNGLCVSFVSIPVYGW